MKTQFLSALVLSTLGPLAASDVALPALVGDHMVLQREDEVKVWGWAEPGEAVTVTASWSGAAKSTVTDAEGSWSVMLATGPAGGPHSLTIKGRNEVVVNDVLLGEVWVCGGQSNMEWRLMDSAPHYDEDIAKADHSTIRLIEVPHRISPTPTVDFDGAWQVCDPSVAPAWTGVGFFFGRELEQELDVPIGLISCNWGGTVAEAWTSESTLRDWDDFRGGLDTVRAEAADPESSEEQRSKRLEDWWSGLDEIDQGTREGWQAPDFDDSEWRKMEVPNDWADTPLGAFDGIAWMRRGFTAPDGWDGKPFMLELGPIDDMDTTWVNGTLVGGMQERNRWNTDRLYEIPAGVVHAGENVIAVRVYDSGGGGGLHGKAEQLGIAPVDVSRPLSLAGTWRYAASTPQSELPAWPNDGVLHQHYPTVLYNGMLAPVTDYAMRGVIWYQGESNRSRHEQYRELFPAMIRDWRTNWGRGDFPFYFVQIAPFAYGNDTGETSLLREAQMHAQRLPNTGMAVTMDVGNPRDIHPKNKRDVGHRLALWALAKTYEREIAVWSGPQYRGVELEEGALRLHFDSVGEGLQARGGGELTHFQVAGVERVFHDAQAKIEGATIVVSSPDVPAPIEVRYGWGTIDEPNLMNSAGLPASSFRTDTW
jgi:sialate O-acetylesterase